MVRLKFRNNRSLSFPEILDKHLETHDNTDDSHSGSASHGYASTRRSKLISDSVTERAFCPPSTSIPSLLPADRLFVDTERPIDEIQKIPCPATSTSTLEVEHVETLSLPSIPSVSDQQRHVPQLVSVEVHAGEVQVEANFQVSPDSRLDSPSRRKRPRDESPVHIRKTRAKTDLNHMTKCLPAFGKSSPISFLGRNLPPSVIAKILLYLPEHDFIQITIHFLLPGVCTSMTYLNSQIQREKNSMNNLKNFPANGPLTQPQKILLGQLIRNRECETDKDGCIIIPHTGSGGKAKRFLRVPKIQTSSGDAVKRTKDRRSQLIEKVEKIVATPSLKDGKEVSDESKHVHDQRVNNIKRDKVGYSAAAEEAGLKIVSRFSKDTVLSLRSIMTLRMWRVLKRVFKDEVGWDVFGSVDQLQQETRKMEFEYECGTVTSNTGTLFA